MREGYRDASASGLVEEAISMVLVVVVMLNDFWVISRSMMNVELSLPRRYHHP
jgi:hypothetical protein